MTRGTLALTGLLAAAAAASWLLLGRREQARPAPPAGIEALEPGYYLLGASLVGLDSDGHALYTVRAQRIEQQPTDGSVSLQQVTVDYTASARTPWTVTAASGHIPASGDVIELTGDVHLSRAGTTAAEQLDITTASLVLAVRKRIASTPDPITLSQGTDTLSATGFEADLNTERFRLESHVRGRFLPENS